jgi:hypothetical protein
MIRFGTIGAACLAVVLAASTPALAQGGNRAGGFHGGGAHFAGGGYRGGGFRGGHGGFGPGIAAGLVAGAVIGGAGYYGSGYSPGYYDDSYAYDNSDNSYAYDNGYNGATTTAMRRGTALFVSPEPGSVAKTVAGISASNRSPICEKKGGRIGRLFCSHPLII